jgi:hypothetical protein
LPAIFLFFSPLADSAALPPAAFYHNGSWNKADCSTWNNVVPHEYQQFMQNAVGKSIRGTFESLPCGWVRKFMKFRKDGARARVAQTAAVGQRLFTRAGGEQGRERHRRR